MGNFPCVVLLGARQVGKSTILNNIRSSTSFFDLENESDFLRINNDPSLVFKEEAPPYIFDEAQLCPKLFNSLRVEIDKKRSVNGRFLLSGSSSPELLKHITESLAGRVAILEVPTFEWSECSQKKQSEFYNSFHSLDMIKSLKPKHTHKEILDLCLMGSYPEPFLKRGDKRFYDLWYQNYFKTYIERDIRSLFPTLNIDAYKRFVHMLAFSTGEILNASNYARSLDVSQPTIKKYLDIVAGTFLWRKLPSYEKSKVKRVTKMPRGHLRDTGLINYLLNVNTVTNLKGHQLYGRIWEGFVIEQILKGLERNLIKHSAYFYRTNNQSEIDLILEGNFGTIPIEIKSGSSTSKKQLKILERFVKIHECPFGIVVNHGDDIFMIAENIIQVPAIFL